MRTPLRIGKEMRVRKKFSPPRKLYGVVTPGVMTPAEGRHLDNYGLAGVWVHEIYTDYISNTDPSPKKIVKLSLGTFSFRLGIFVLLDR